METKLYKLKCLTNLHVGSGETNFNIIDQEVEKDAITHYPVIPASGVKGALRDAADSEVYDTEYIFGKKGTQETGNPGAYRFFEAKFLSRPLRVGGEPTMAYIPVTTITALKNFFELTSAFDCNPFADSVDLNTLTFGENVEFLVSDASIKNIEGICGNKIATIDNEKKIKLCSLLGDKFAIAKDITEYDLPSVARNVLENGISKNLWYEEFVPHQSVFYLLVQEPDIKTKNQKKKPLDIKDLDIVQFGGNASVGNGFIQISKFTEQKED